jgi:nitroimidazol reductase NimA-like FMN-containing flavoprotein (pyridoxamine 5'-phosphate oxidase superfamily)
MTNAVTNSPPASPMRVDLGVLLRLAPPQPQQLPLVFLAQRTKTLAVREGIGARLVSMTTTGDVTAYEPTERTTVRVDDRASYDRRLVHAILDEALVCHVGFATDRGPFVIPTIHVRVDETLYVHGSPATRMLRTLARGIDVCVTVTLLDGLVLARSAFHHSMNYRSVVVLGRAMPVTDLDEKARVLDELVTHIAGAERQGELRPHTEKEIRGTAVLALPLDEVSAKVRTGGPLDEPADLDLPVWAGVVPLTIEQGEPVPDLAP